MLKIFTNQYGTEFVEFAAPSPGSTLKTEIATRQIDGFWTTFYQTVPNPDPVLRKTGNYIDILDEIKRDQRVSPCALSRRSGVLLRKWKLEPNDATPASVETVEKILKDMKLRAVIGDILQAWGYGYQVSEVVWRADGNLLVPTVTGKPARWFMFGKNNELRMKRTSGDVNGIELEPFKMLLTRYLADYDNPYGHAEFSLCYWPVTLRKGGIKFWAKALERFGTPHAVGKHARNSSTTERNDLIRMLKLLVSDAVAAIPDDGSVELLEANISGSSDAHDRYARYHDSQISTVILGHAGSSESTPGRLGNDDTALKVRADIIENDCSMVQDTINTLIEWIYVFNPSLGTEKPSFELYEETDINKERADVDIQLLNTGKVKLAKKYFVNNYNFAEDEIEVNYDVQEPTVKPLPLPEKTKLPEFSAPRTIDPQTDIDALVDKLSDAETLQKEVEVLLKPVFDMFENAESYDDARDKIAKLYPDIDEAKIQTLVEKVSFLGETWGRINSTEE